MSFIGILAMAVAVVGFAACSSMEIGGGSSPVTGSAGTTGDAKGAASSLVTCQEPVGTIALVESQIPASPRPASRPRCRWIWLIAAQSRCFNVVERGQALTRMLDERNLAAGNMLQPGANVGQGQMVAADYMVTPERRLLTEQRRRRRRGVGRRSVHPICGSGFRAQREPLRERAVQRKHRR